MILVGMPNMMVLTSDVIEAEKQSPNIPDISGNSFAHASPNVENAMCEIDRECSWLSVIRLVLQPCY